MLYFVITIFLWFFKGIVLTFIFFKYRIILNKDYVLILLASARKITFYKLIIAKGLNVNVFSFTFGPFY